MGDVFLRNSDLILIYSGEELLRAFRNLPPNFRSLAATHTDSMMTGMQGVYIVINPPPPNLENNFPKEHRRGEKFLQPKKILGVLRRF